MPFEPIYNDINLTIKKAERKDQIKTECKTELSSEGVSKLLNLSARSVILNSSVQDSCILYEGKVTFFICYLDQDGQVKKSECSSEFNGKLNGEEIGCHKAVVDCKVERTEADLSGARLSVVAVIGVEAEVTDCNRVSALVGGENLIVNPKDVVISRGYGLKETTFLVEDEFEVNLEIQEVLSQKADAVITSATCGVGCIIVEGDIYLSAIVLQSGVKNGIIREDRTLPFKAEIECEDAMPTMTATAFVKEKSFKTDVVVDSDRAKSVVNAQVTLALMGEAFYTDSVNLVSDAFSVTEKLELEKADCPFYKPCQIKSENTVVSGRATIDELPVGVTMLATSNERVEVVSVTTDDKITVTGVLSATTFFCDVNGKIFTRKSETPFTIESEKEQNTCEYTVRATAQTPTVKMISATELELCARVFITFYPWEKDCLTVVKTVKTVGEKKECDCALSVYIPREGEELWSLAKRLNVCPETLLASNPELQFPLSGKERIVVYRQQNKY